MRCPAFKCDVRLDAGKPASGVECTAKYVTSVQQKQWLRGEMLDFKRTPAERQRPMERSKLFDEFDGMAREIRI